MDIVPILTQFLKVQMMDLGLAGSSRVTQSVAIVFRKAAIEKPDRTVIKLLWGKAGENEQVAKP